MSARESIMLVVTVAALALSGVAFGVALDTRRAPAAPPDRIVVGDERSGFVIEHSEHRNRAELRTGTPIVLEQDDSGSSLTIGEGNLMVVLETDANGARLELVGPHARVSLESDDRGARFVMRADDQRIELAADGEAAWLEMARAGERNVQLETHESGSSFVLADQGNRLTLKQNPVGTAVEVLRRGELANLCELDFGGP